MITARIETQTRIIPVQTPNDKDSAIKCLQDAVHTLTPEDGKCRFVVLDKDHNKEIYSWEYQPTFRPDLEQVKKKKVEEVEESKYDWGYVCYILKKGKELDYDNFYKDEFDCAIDFDDEKEAHEFMRKKGYGRDEYDIAYEYSVWPKDEDWVGGCTLGFTKKQTRESLNKCLEHYNLKLLANGKVKEL